MYSFRIENLKLLDMKFRTLDLKNMYDIGFGFDLYRVWCLIWKDLSLWFYTLFGV